MKVVTLPNTNTITKLYTVKQVADVLGVSTNTLYKYLGEGKIKSLRFSKRGRFRISETELTRLLGTEEDMQRMSKDILPERKSPMFFLDIFKKIFS